MACRHGASPRMGVLVHKAGWRDTACNIPSSEYGKLLLIIGATGFLATGIEAWTTIAPALLGVIAVAVTCGPLRTSSETVAAVAGKLIALLALFGSAAAVATRRPRPPAIGLARSPCPARSPASSRCRSCWRSRRSGCGAIRRART